MFLPGSEAAGPSSAPVEAEKTLVSKQFLQLESVYVLFHSSGPGAEK